LPTAPGVLTDGNGTSAPVCPQGTTVHKAARQLAITTL
jgi:hypothetical protein